jgi:hypothetical protein
MTHILSDLELNPSQVRKFYYFELAIVNDRMADNNPLESLTRPLLAEVSLKGSLVSEANFTAVVQHKITVPTGPWPKDK